MNNMEVLTVNGQSFAVADGEARRRLDGMEAGYRYLGTVTSDTESGTTRLEIHEDSGGNPFACRDFLVLATFPQMDSGYSTQLYIGPQAWKWIGYLPSAMSYSTKRTWRLHLYHLAGGKWCIDGVYTDSDLFYQSFSGTVGTLFSIETPGETMSQLLFSSNASSYFPLGTTFEIYGK